MSLYLNQYSILPIPNDDITEITIDVNPGYLLSFPNLDKLSIIGTDVNLRSLHHLTFDSNDIDHIDVVRIEYLLHCH